MKDLPKLVEVLRQVGKEDPTLQVMPSTKRPGNT